MLEGEGLPSIIQVGARWTPSDDDLRQMLGMETFLLGYMGGAYPVFGVKGPVPYGSSREGRPTRSLFYGAGNGER